jgi:hypothetical protein
MRGDRAALARKAVAVPRETVEAKDRRYLVEGRLIVERVDESGVRARARGGGETYELGSRVELAREVGRAPLLTFGDPVPQRRPVPNQAPEASGRLCRSLEMGYGKGVRSAAA